jgi:hypothetical protein
LTETDEKRANTSMFNIAQRYREVGSKPMLEVVGYLR